MKQTDRVVFEPPRIRVYFFDPSDAERLKELAEEKPIAPGGVILKPDCSAYKKFWIQNGEEGVVFYRGNASGVIFIPARLIMKMVSSDEFSNPSPTAKH